MVGIVLVSHSPKLAEGLKELVDQLAQGRTVIATAAGAADGGLGTDAVAIAEAIRRANAGSGVVVLMDLGSAILSAETALELLPDSWRDSVLLCDAPLVEGAVAAGVEASLGSPPAEVRRAAEGAVTAKRGESWR